MTMVSFDMISAAIDQANWTAIMQVVVLIGVMLSIFRMQTAEQLEEIVGCNAHHGFLGTARRLGHFLTAIVLLWCAIYGYERGWQPWPPMVVFVIVFDFATLVGIAIMRQDIHAHKIGQREVVYHASQTQRSQARR